MKIRGDLQNAIDQSFFQLFLNGNSEYNYQLFRKLFLTKAMNLKLDTEVSREYLVNFADLNLKPDFLRKIPVTYVPRKFDSEIFSKQLSKSLEPKQFNLPECTESIDFSKKIVQDYNALKQSLLECVEDEGIQVVDRKKLISDLKFSLPEYTESIDSPKGVVQDINVLEQLSLEHVEDEGIQMVDRTTLITDLESGNVDVGNASPLGEAEVLLSQRESALLSP